VAKIISGWLSGSHTGCPGQAALHCQIGCWLSQVHTLSQTSKACSTDFCFHQQSSNKPGFCSQSVSMQFLCKEILGCLQVTVAEHSSDHGEAASDHQDECEGVQQVLSPSPASRQDVSQCSKKAGEEVVSHALCGSGFQCPQCSPEGDEDVLSLTMQNPFFSWSTTMHGAIDFGWVALMGHRISSELFLAALSSRSLSPHPRHFGWCLSHCLGCHQTK